MPKRSNEFQRLVFLVKQQVAPEASVVESEFLTDRRIGKAREVDVVIRQDVAGHPIVVSVECTTAGRPADIGWVERMKAKHDDLDTNHLVLVTAAGYTRDAQEFAAAQGITALTFGEINEGTVQEFAGDLPRYIAKTVELSIEEVTLDLVLPDDSIRHIKASPDYALCDPEGREVGAVLQLAAGIVRHPGLMERVLPVATDDHRYAIVKIPGPSSAPQFAPDSPVYLRDDDSGELHRVGRVGLKLRVSVKTTDVAMRHGLMGDTRVSWGEAELRGEDALVLDVLEPGGKGSVSVVRGGFYGTRVPLSAAEDSVEWRTTDEGVLESEAPLRPQYRSSSAGGGSVSESGKLPDTEAPPGSGG